MTKRLPLSKENLIYVGLWLLLFIAPATILYFRTTSDAMLEFRWYEVFHIWTLFATYLVIFLIHNFVLAPLLIYKHKRGVYLLSTLGLAVAFLVFQYANKPKNFQHGRPPFVERILHDSAQAGRGYGPHFNNRMPRHGDRHFDDPMPPFFMGAADLVAVLVMVGLLGLNLGVKLYFKNEEDLHNMQKLENKNLQHQLEYLKYQINPHFFMNTLNNIHALVDIDPAKAKATIVELSRMMRYVLYEGDKSLIPVLREIEFLHNYVRLMKLRYTERVEVNVDIPVNLSEGMIPPLLLITFLENAFKHGVSYQQDSFIHIIMDQEDGMLFFKCINSKKAPVPQQDPVPSEGGLGLKNVKQRLDLIYGENYTLEFKDTLKTYEVYLRLPLRESKANEK